MAKSKEISEEKSAASSYILTFYQNVLYLTHNYSNYENVLLELKTKHKNVDQETDLDIEEKKALLESAQNCRYYLHRTYIEYNTIMKGLNQEVPPVFEELWLKIKDQFIVKIEDLVEYVMLMNDALQKQIMKELLVKSSDIVDKIYGEQETKKDDGAGE